MVHLLLLWSHAATEAHDARVLPQIRLDARLPLDERLELSRVVPPLPKQLVFLLMPLEDHLRNSHTVPAMTASTFCIVSASEFGATGQKLHEAHGVPELGLGALEAVWMHPRRAQEIPDGHNVRRRGEIYNTTEGAALQTAHLLPTDGASCCGEGLSGEDGARAVGERDVPRSGNA